LKHEDELDVIFGFLGKIYSSIGETELAKAYYKRGIEMALRTRDLKPAAISYTGLATLYQQQGHSDSAFSYAQAGFEAARQTSWLEDVIRSGSLLAQLFEERKQFDSANFYNKVVVAAKDSLFTNEKSNKVDALNYSEQVRLRELEQQQKQQEQERKTNLQFAAIAISLLTVLVLFLVLSQRFITSARLIQVLGLVVLLFVFEFINLLIHPFIGNLTHHSPLLMLLIMVAVAGVLIPAHHYLEKWVTHRLVEKNKRVRLEAAKRTIAKLEGKETEHTQ
jgi:tetratricopeptide (TPR) repeat protein